MYNDPHDYEDDEHTIIAHFSPQEIEDLNGIQGGGHADKRTGLPSFEPLLKMLMHPQAISKISSLMDHKPSQEGIGKIIGDSGRFGDTKAAVLPRALGDFLDGILNDGKPSINPKTGKREYFLGSLFGGLKSIFSPISSAISSVGSALAPMAGHVLSGLAPQLGNLASEGIGKLGSAVGMGDIGNQLGSAIGGTVSNLAEQGGDQLQSGNFNPNSLLRTAASGLSSGLAPVVQSGIKSLAPMMGSAAGDALTGIGADFGLPPELTAGLSGMAGNAVSSLANMGGNAAGSLLNHMSSNIDNRQNPMAGAGRNVAGTAGTYMNNNYSQNLPGNAALTGGLNSYAGGASPSDAMNYGAQQGINAMQNPAAQYAAQGGLNSFQNYRGGMGAGQSLNQGYGSVDPQMYQNMQNQALERAQRMPMFNRRAAI